MAPSVRSQRSEEQLSSQAMPAENIPPLHPLPVRVMERPAPSESRLRRLPYSRSIDDFGRSVAGPSLARDQAPPPRHGYRHLANTVTANELSHLRLARNLPPVQDEDDDDETGLIAHRNLHSRSVPPPRPLPALPTIRVHPAQDDARSKALPFNPLGMHPPMRHGRPPILPTDELETRQPAATNPASFGQIDIDAQVARMLEETRRLKGEPQSAAIPTSATTTRGFLGTPRQALRKVSSSISGLIPRSQTTREVPEARSAEQVEAPPPSTPWPRAREGAAALAGWQPLPWPEPQESPVTADEVRTNEGRNLCVPKVRQLALGGPRRSPASGGGGGPSREPLLSRGRAEGEDEE